MQLSQHRCHHRQNLLHLAIGQPVRHCSHGWSCSRLKSSCTFYLKRTWSWMDISLDGRQFEAVLLTKNWHLSKRSFHMAKYSFVMFVFCISNGDSKTFVVWLKINDVLIRALQQESVWEGCRHKTQYKVFPACVWHWIWYISPESPFLLTRWVDKPRCMSINPIKI